MSQYSRTLLPLALLLGSACQQETFFLGAFKRDAGASDAAAEPDATNDPERDGSVAPSPMSVSLSTRGRSNVLALTALCGSDCTAVRVMVQGGSPPYEVLWDDGKKGMARTLCADPTRARSAVVNDASGGVNAPAVLSLGVIDFDACTGSDQPAWRACFAVDTVVEEPCPDYVSNTLTYEIMPAIPYGSSFSVKTVLSGPRASTLPYATGYALSAYCDVNSINGVSGFSGSGGDEKNVFEFSGSMPFEISYFAIDGSLLLGLLDSESDAGLVGEAESVVVCEDTVD